MQHRYVDRSKPYSIDTWRQLYANTNTPGVYSGYALSPSTVSGSEVVIGAGALMLPSGIVVVEDTAISVAIGGTFPPAASTNYTVRTHHSEAAVGLLGGEDMTYSVVSGLLTAQPSDGIILGWIRHPGGSIALAQEHITNAPKYAPALIAQNYIARNPYRRTPPADFVSELETGVFETEGFDAAPTFKAWRGYGNTTQVSIPIPAPHTPTATAYVQYPVTAEPYEIRVESIIPIGDQIAVTVYDTAGATVTTATLTSHASYTVDTIEIPPGVGTWTTEEKAVVKLVVTTAINTTVKISDFIIDFWPYELPRLL